MSKNNFVEKTAKFNGLTNKEVLLLREKYGPNVLISGKKTTPIVALISKFKSPLILLLIAASVISIALGQRTEAIIILFMVFISGILDFVNSYKSEKAAETLARKVAVTATVRRNGRDMELTVKEIVPGDIIILGAGDIVPADCQVLEAKDFFVNQSALTGESFPVEKTAPLSVVSGKEVDSSRADLVFMGSSVATGFAIVEVIKTGAHTQYGTIATRLSGVEAETDFEHGIKHFSFFIIQLVFILVIFVFFINAILNRGVFESFVFSLAVAIGLTPELLPVVISIALSHGSILMAKKDVIVKNLSSIQNFGGMTVLCTDKTGTLTEDKITLVKYIDILGVVSEPVLFFSYLNSIFHTGISNPLDLAIKEWKNFDVSNYKKVDEIPFDFLRRRMSVVVEKDRQRVLITKGAPEAILDVCDCYQKQDACHKLNAEYIERAKSGFDALSKEGFRVLAVATKEMEKTNQIYEKDVEKKMMFLGFIAFYDPPKPTASETIKELEKLGVEIKIITGDNEILTATICREIKLEVKGVLTGDDVDRMSDVELRKKAIQTTIFSRIDPIQKERIIVNLKTAKCAVGYLGDGINDAPALRAADVGISVNNAVDVAKETADIILLRKSLRVLKDGVVEGRKTFQNTMKYIFMGLSSNFGNMFSMAGLSLFLPFFPMLPAQILLNNLLYDISQFTLPTDPVDSQDIRRPLRWNIKFIKKYMLVFGPVSSVFDFSTFFVMWYFFHPNIAQFQTAWFMESLATQTLIVYVIRTRKIPFVQSSPGRWLLLSTILVVAVGWLIPFLSFGRVFQFEALSPLMMTAIALLVLIYMVLVQLIKSVFYKRMWKHFENNGQTNN